MNDTHEEKPIWWVALEWTGPRTMRVNRVYRRDGPVVHEPPPVIKITDPLVQDEIGAFNHARRMLERLGIEIN